jgi:hypothetical protein
MEALAVMAALTMVMEEAQLEAQPLPPLRGFKEGRPKQAEIDYLSHIRIRNVVTKSVGL